MSIAISSKLKYPEYFIKELVSQHTNNKDNISLIKQMQNLKLNKYAKYFNGIGKAKQTSSSKSKEKDIRKEKIKNIKNNLNQVKKNISTQEKEKHDTEIEDLEASLVSFEQTGGAAGNISNRTKSTNATAKDTHPLLNNQLDVIIELETQRTETLSNTTKSLILSQSIRKTKEVNSNLNLNFILFNDDKEDINQLNPQTNFEYLMDIHHNLLQEEKNIKNLSLYMPLQHDINEKMRAILIDWVIDVHYKFKLTPETLFLSVYLIDRYLSEKNIKRDRLQLIGVAALLIACKYEEIFSPELRDFEYITDKAYRKEEITHLEIEMLKLFQFDITVPSSFRFFEIISLKLNFSEKEFCLGRYFLEIFLIDYRYTKYLPSQIACAVCFLVISFTTVNEKGNNKACYKLRNFLELYNCDIGEFLRDCCKDICFILENVDMTGLISAKRKFLSPEFFTVAKFNSKLNC